MLFSVKTNLKNSNALINLVMWINFPYQEICFKLDDCLILTMNRISYFFLLKNNNN